MIVLRNRKRNGGVGQMLKPKNKYPLYTGESVGASYDKGGKCYKLVIITQWSAPTENAKERGHKAYYFETTKLTELTELSNKLDNEDFCKQVYTYPEYSRLKIREEIMKC